MMEVRPKVPKIREVGFHLRGLGIGPVAEYGHSFANEAGRVWHRANDRAFTAGPNGICSGGERRADRNQKMFCRQRGSDLSKHFFGLMRLHAK